VTKGKLLQLVSGIKVRELARIAGVSENYVTNVLAGRVKPSRMVLSRIAEALGLELDEVQEELKAEEIVAQCWHTRWPKEEKTS